MTERIHPDTLQQICFESRRQTQLIQADPWVYPRPTRLQRLQRYLPLPRDWFKDSVPPPRLALAVHDDRYHGGEKQHANPTYAASQAAQFFDGLRRPAKTSLRCAFWNVEFGNDSKYQRYKQLYDLVVAQFGLLGLIECDVAFATALAGKTHRVYSADVNSRGQGNHILVRAGIKVRETFQIGEVADVFGIPDLRPPIVVVVELNGKDYVFSVTHNKSMRQGKTQTEPARTEQNQRHIARLQKYRNRIIQGDLNTELNASHPDTRPFEAAGLERYPSRDNRATNKHGNPIDGIYRDPSVSLTGYELGLGEAFWNDRAIGTSVSDHALVIYDVQDAVWAPEAVHGFSHYHPHNYPPMVGSYPFNY